MRRSHRADEMWTAGTELRHALAEAYLALGKTAAARMELDRVAAALVGADP